MGFGIGVGWVQILVLPFLGSEALVSLLWLSVSAFLSVKWGR